MHSPKPNPDTRAGADWPSELYRILKAADVRQMSYVPDAGHSQLIRPSPASPSLRSLPPPAIPGLAGISPR